MQANCPTRRLGYDVEKNDGSMDFIVIPKALRAEVYRELIALHRPDHIFSLANLMANASLDTPA